MNVSNPFSSLFTPDKYRVEFETGSCKSEPVYLDFTNRTVRLQSYGKLIGGKKISLCNNEALLIGISHNVDEEVYLYKDGKVVETKPASALDRVSFNVSETGKYYIKTINIYCNPINPVFSDTVEVAALAPISTLLKF